MLNKYHIYVTFPGVGELEVFPKNDAIRFGWEKTNDVWRKKVDTKLWFINEVNGTKTFDILASMELEECGCHRLDMRLTLECAGGEENDLFAGILFFIDGTWYFDFCSVEMKPRVNDPFECLFKNWETDVNILEGSGDAITLATDTGQANFEHLTCSNDYPLPGGPIDPIALYRNDYQEDCLTPDPGDNWQVLLHHVIITNHGAGDIVSVATQWTRETYTGVTPPGNGWTLVSPGFWSRKAILSGPVVEEVYFEEYLATWTEQHRVLDNGRLLSAVLINLFGVCSDYQLRSDFFGIDPDGLAPVNDAYTYAQQWFWDAVVFNTQDVVKLNAGENTTVCNINLSKLMTCIRRFPKVFLYFDEDNQVYRIEHESFERQTKLINMVTKRPDAIRGYNTYEYEKTRIPQKELFKFSYPTNDPDWDNASIVYADCNDVGRIETYEIDCFHTDFGNLVGSGIEDIDVLKGLVLVGQKDGYINRGIGDISGEYKINAGLSWANVVRELWRWRMPSCEALVNGVQTTFLSLIPKIKGATFQAELCCMDILVLNPAIDRVRTGLGNGEFFNEISIDLGSGLADWVLLYAPPITLVDISVSISVNDDNQCYYTDFIFETNEDFPSGVVITWDFGIDAIPAMATGQGPHAVQYTSVGVKTVTVTAAYNGEEESAQIEVTVVACPANITGKVLDDFAKPFQGATVRLFNDPGHNGIPVGGAIRTVFTNSAGNFAMATLTPGYYVVVLTQPANWETISDYNTGDATGSSDNTNDLPNTSGTDHQIPITLAPSEVDGYVTFIQNPLPGIIRGNVKDNLGNNIVGATVTLHADNNNDGVADGAALYTVVTDASGNYEFLSVPVDGGAHSGATANTAYQQYVIVLTVPGGYTIVSGIDTSNDTDLVANTPTTDNVIPVTMRPNEIDADNNFIIQ